MTSPVIEHILLEPKLELWDKPGTDAYACYDVFDEHFYNQLKSSVEALVKADKKTYMIHGTKFNLEDQERKVISHKQNGREIYFIYDTSFERGWFYQTKDTIKEWSDECVRKNASPIFYKYIKALENLPPFNEEKDNWLFYKMHINYLPQGRVLSIHYDNNPMLYDTPGYRNLDHTDMDHTHARTRSVTYYMYDHIEGLGGEFWTLDGFVFKPRKNSLVNINGNQAIHGVTMNMQAEPRMAVTVRVAHKDDLFLPGSPDKVMYDVTNV